jgi:hypothetical protein
MLKFVTQNELADPPSQMESLFVLVQEQPIITVN